jgi:hypothetical protein
MFNISVILKFLTFRIELFWGSRPEDLTSTKAAWVWFLALLIGMVLGRVPTAMKDMEVFRSLILALLLYCSSPNLIFTVISYCPGRGSQIDRMVRRPKYRLSHWVQKKVLKWQGNKKSIMYMSTLIKTGRHISDWMKNLNNSSPTSTLATTGDTTAQSTAPTVTSLFLLPDLNSYTSDEGPQARLTSCTTMTRIVNSMAKLGYHCTQLCNIILVLKWIKYGL